MHYLLYYDSSEWNYHCQLLFLLDGRRDSMFCLHLGNLFALSHVFSKHNSEFTD